MTDTTESLLDEACRRLDDLEPKLDRIQENVKKMAARLEATERVVQEARAVGAYFRYGPLIKALNALWLERRTALALKEAASPDAGREAGPGSKSPAGP